MGDETMSQFPPSVKTSIDSIVRHIARPIRGCATDDQYTDVVERATEALNAAAETLVRAGWQPIETAPKEIEWANGFHEFGPLILAYPVNGKVGTVEWWQSSRNPGAHNFLDGSGNAAYPTHWMPLPAPPAATNLCGICGERPATVLGYRMNSCEPCFDAEIAKRAIQPKET